jgi:L-arabinokinase
VIVAYVSGHGYGHATRVAEVLRAVRAQERDAPLAVVTAAPERLFRDTVPGPLVFRSRECDVGLAQKGPLLIDEAETARQWRRFVDESAARVDEEARWLRGAGARLVVGDVPPLAFEAAAAAGVPAVGLTNFSWDWIYRHLARRQPSLNEAAAVAAAAYGKAALLLQLPFAGDLSAFPRREPIPMVARRPRMSRAEARARLALPRAGACVLVSFGGIGMPRLDLRALGALRAFHFLIDEAEGALPSNVMVVDAARREARGMRYQDLVTAADVVVTKPGYGIVTDAIAAGARIVYTERGDFPEYPILVAEMPRYVPCAHLGNDDLLAGRWGPAIESVLARMVPPPPDLGGADVAARRLLALA